MISERLRASKRCANELEEKESVENAFKGQYRNKLRSLENRLWIRKDFFGNF